MSKRATYANVCQDRERTCKDSLDMDDRIKVRKKSE